MLLMSSTDPSSSEQSCDTVIYVGSNGAHDEDTDAEHPPVFIPRLDSGDHRGQMSKVCLICSNFIHFCLVFANVYYLF
jgi:hypothetical protein